MSGGPISRRQALALLGLGTAGVAAGTAGWATSAGAPTDRNRTEPGASGERLRQPPVAASRGGVLDVTLTAAPGARLTDRDTSAWAFNGTCPGPTLRMRPGDVLRARLINHIDQPTNLHTHGLHVSPHGNGDNPFVTVEPGNSFDYAIAVPADHPAGTFWYHPHHHGTVADQIFAGLAGALLVDGGPDPVLPVSDDLVLLVTDTTLDGAGRVASPSMMARMMGREGDLVLANGQHQPVIAAAPGAVQRWRVINGCVSRVLALRLEGHRLTQVALDGVFLPAPADRDQVVLAPGNRADLLVRATRTGRYALVSEPYNRGSLGMMGGMMHGGPFAAGPVTLATLVASGTATAPAVLPARLPAPSIPSDSVSTRRQITFAMGMGGIGMGGMAFTIDGRTFDPGRDDQTVALNTTEEWTVVNTSPMDHAFHLHAWPFHVLTGAPAAGVRQDVVLVPARASVRLRIPFTDYPGRSVYHCHVLDHEDLGMMATVNVRP
ncbi:multicopper oxidase family protein [Streptomyces sp. GbtcB6]|uniref:multicopper oxidase family protein n=1 Tax=Streptomyces sp. GbtcB6 TaxID=2824751 RepID=UPI001C2F3D75|nr:multicopper oxidase family protein [Streptomyces sp. GbtcB6]